ncbi:RHS repeat-associated core domain-containing protein [Streptomyces canus]|uniref:RHS repeat-associated core domain-containing protein n=1 Tax=Streptomyces canus TaxID=58343 RepID=UPI0036E8CD33
MKYLFNDPQGTASLAMDTTTQQVARQQYTPYGQPRSSTNTTAWPDPTHSDLGKPQDTSTGYTDVGARKYDPALGSFISLDPVFEAASPQELGGYAYAADNPIADSDPTGLESCWSCPASWCKRPCPTRSGKPCVGCPVGPGSRVAQRLTWRQRCTVPTRANATMTCGF